MGLKFSIPYQIPFYETDITHHVKLPHLLAFSLQVSGMQSESLGNWIRTFLIITVLFGL